jgi:hypothetical protein
VVVQTEDAPCGGAVGTEHSSVESLINVHSDATITQGIFGTWTLFIPRRRA